MPIRNQGLGGVTADAKGGQGGGEGVRVAKAAREKQST